MSIAKLYEQLQFFFECKKCPRKFVSSKSLNSHICDQSDVPNMETAMLTFEPRKGENKVEYIYNERYHVFPQEQISTGSQETDQKSINIKNHPVKFESTLKIYQKTNIKTKAVLQGAKKEHEELDIAAKTLLTSVEWLPKLKCQHCVFETIIQHEFVNHIETIHQQPNFKCEYCDTYFSNNQTLLSHSIEIHTNYPQQEVKPNCSTCGTLFRGKDAMDSHMCGGQDSMGALEIDENLKSLDEKEITKQLVRHSGPDQTKQMQIFQCLDKSCVEVFRQKTSRKCHMSILHTLQHEEKFKCNECYELLIDKHTLLRHMKKHSDKTEFQCRMCSKQFKYKDSLYVHLKLHKTPINSVNTTRNFECLDTTCDEVFTLWKLRKNHMKTVHGMKRQGVKAKCDQCNKVVFDKYTLMRHMQKHSDKKEFLCVLCPKQFKHSDSLANHIKAHNGVFDFHCPDCEKKYTNRDALLGHKMKKHTKSEYIFTCDQCGYVSKSKENFKHHITIHTGEKQFKCKEGCEKSFRNRTARLHHETLHRGVKQFQCSQCDKKFMQKHQLIVHIKRHKGIKNHKCQECGKAFVEPAGARHCKHTLNTAPTIV